MKTLTLLRHAKSGWDEPATRDLDRALNDKGRRAARTIGRDLRHRDARFDAVVASPARRVVETVAEVEAGLGRALDPRWERQLYLAPAATLVEIIQALPADSANALLIGHNPGLEELVLMLAPDGALRGEVARKFPTASLAELVFTGDDWSGVGTGTATLSRFVRPRDLDPALGPDAD